jgi:hypothetical protein
MPENENAAGTAQREAVKADWSAISEDYSEVVIKNDAPKTEEVNPAQVDNAEQTPPEEVKNETPKVEEKKDETDPKDVKTDESQKTPTEETKVDSLLSLEDLKDVPKTYDDGTWKGTAKDLFGIDVEDESYEAVQKAFKENFVPKTELEKLKEVSIDTIYSQLKPETVASLKLIELGIPEDKVFAPTKEIDGYLGLDDASLVRADLENTEGWAGKQELIDARIEELAADPKKLNLAAEMIRIDLNNQKKQIVETRNTILKQSEERRQNAILQQRQQEAAQFNEALNKLETFMGQPVSKEIKEAIRLKHNNGGYAEIVNKADSQINAIMYKEFGDKLVKHLQNKASEEAKLDQTKKLLNIPPVTGANGKRVDVNANNQKDAGWGAIIEDFKN